MFEWRRGALGALIFVVLLATPVAASASERGRALHAESAGGIGLRLIDVPVAAQSDPRARLYIVDHLAPGSVIERRIEVSNTTAATVHVVLYAAAATVDNGSFLGAEGHTPNDLSSWASVGPGAFDMPADGRSTATVTITAPDDAAPGEQYAVVWAEARSGSAGAGGVVQVNRVGIRLYVSVGPGGAPAADFTIDSLTAERSTDGRPFIVAAVHNTGGRALDMSGTLQLSAGPGGLSAGPFPATLGVTLAVKETEAITITLDERIPAGPWDAQINLRSGLVERSARATITFPDAGASPTVSTTSPGAETNPAAIAGVGVLLVAGSLVLVLRRRWSVRPG